MKLSRVRSIRRLTGQIHHPSDDFTRNPVLKPRYSSVAPGNGLVVSEACGGSNLKPIVFWKVK